MSDLYAYNYGKDLGYKDNCEDSYDGSDTSLISSNYKTTHIARSNRNTLFNVDNDSSCYFDKNHDQNNNSSIENSSIGHLSNDTYSIKRKRSNSSLNNILNWFSKQDASTQPNITKKQGTRESIKQLFFEQKPNEREHEEEEEDLELKDARYDTIYTLKSNFYNKHQSIPITDDFFNSKLNDEQISKTKFGKNNKQNEFKDVKTYKSILKPTDFKKDSSESRPKSVSFNEETKSIYYNNGDQNISNSNADNANNRHKINNNFCNTEPLSGDTLSSPVKLKKSKEYEEFFDNTVDLSKPYGIKEADDDYVVLKTFLKLDKKTIKLLQTNSEYTIDSDLLRNPKKLLQVYATYISELKTKRYNAEKELKTSKFKREQLESDLNKSNEKISLLKLEVAQLTMDKEDNKKKYSDLYKKIETIKKKSKNYKNMKRYYNDFVSAYCSIVTTLATESTTFEKLQNKNKGYVNEEFFKNQKNLKMKLLELNCRSLNHTFFNSENAVDELRKENNEMFKDIEAMLLQNLDYS